MEVAPSVMRIFSFELRKILKGFGGDAAYVQEIRLRVFQPLLIRYHDEEYFLDSSGNVTESITGAYRVTERDIAETMTYVSNYSLYAYEDEIRQGFITIEGGHRVGIAGKAVVENGKIVTIKYISFINVRIAHEVKGCADCLLPYLFNTNGFCHTMIVSPPGCGKTTMLRDIVRQISDGYMYDAHVSRCFNGDGSQSIKKFYAYTVGLVDERSEIAACYMGVAQNDVGIRTDVLDACKKSDGMLMLLRSMRPDIIAVDEIGSKEDIEAIQYVANCGCRLMATVHASSLDELFMRPIFSKLISEKFFERYVFLNLPKSSREMHYVEAIFDNDKHLLYQNGR